MRRASSPFSPAYLAPLAWLAVSACAAETPPPLPPAPPPAPVSTVVAPTSPPPGAQDDGRLPALAVAKRYELSLAVDPNQPRFAGSVRILVDLPAATQYVVLNARNLNVTHAAAQIGNDVVNAVTAPRIAHGGHVPEELVLTFDRPLAAGAAVLSLTYDAPFDDSLSGLYRVKEGENWYAFTQFEATDARRAFPCFDEPGQKVPFDVRITVPKGLLAVSNMAEVKHSDQPAGASGPAGTLYEFGTSPPLPSYLVAFAVGDFDVRAGQSTPVPIRLITTKGKSGLGTLALEDTAALVKELSAYFGVAYPYPKLDLVAVPNFAAGAMENAGLITFREELLLLDPVHAPQRARIAAAEVIAHELAHQWFGDLVTTAWWDDLWLNEGFATWAEAKVVDLWRPAYHSRLERVAGLGDVMATDSLKSARAVRQPVHSTGEALEAFDGITYNKGAAVLGMIERMLGSDVFQRGIEAYLRENAWKTATANDLLKALSKASGKDVAKLASTFLDRPGVPNVTFDVDCKAKTPTLTLSQSPWHLLGDTDSALTKNASGPWLIPVDLRAAQEELRVMLPDATTTVPLAKCPAWVDPNVGGFGYYRYSLDEKRWAAFAQVIEKQDESARVSFVNNLWAQVRAGSLAPEVFLRVLPAIDGDTSRVVVDAEIDALTEFGREIVSPAAEPAYAKYVAARLTPHLRALPVAKPGSKVAPTPSEDEVLERRSLFRALGDIANDPATLAEAEKLATSWLGDPSSVDGDMARVAVMLASRHAGATRVQALVAAMKSAKNPNDQKTALLGLSSFDDPAVLDQALSIALTEDVRTQDVGVLLLNAVYHPSTRAPATQWIMAHWDGVRAKLPGFLVGRVFGLAGRACTKEDVEKATSFFNPKADGIEGAARPLAEGLETANLCRALHEKDSQPVDQFFKVAGAAGPLTKAPTVSTKPDPMVAKPGKN